MERLPDRHLRWEGSYNSRDLGGYRTAEGGETRWRAVVRADNLCRLTPRGQAALVAYGVRTIIDLRSAAELALAPHPFSSHTGSVGPVTYLHLPLLVDDNNAETAPIDDATSLQDMYALTDETSRDALVVILERSKAPLAAVLRAIVGAEPGGVLVHCHAGKDRTGLVAALLLALAGVARPMIAADYAASARYLQPLYEKLRAAGASDPAWHARLAQQFTCVPQSIDAVFAYLEMQHGGVEGYLRSAGMEERDLACLRERLHGEDALSQ